VVLPADKSFKIVRWTIQARPFFAVWWRLVSNH
jgi:hypothetical protein